MDGEIRPIVYPLLLRGKYPQLAAIAHGGRCGRRQARACCSGDGLAIQRNDGGLAILAGDARRASPVSDGASCGSAIAIGRRSSIGCASRSGGCWSIELPLSGSISACSRDITDAADSRNLRRGCMRHGPAGSGGSLRRGCMRHSPTGSGGTLRRGCMRHGPVSERSSRNLVPPLCLNLSLPIVSLAHIWVRLPVSFGVNHLLNSLPMLLHRLHVLSPHISRNILKYLVLSLLVELGQHPPIEDEPLLPTLLQLYSDDSLRFGRSNSICSLRQQQLGLLPFSRCPNSSLEHRARLWPGPLPGL